MSWFNGNWDTLEQETAEHIRKQPCREARGGYEYGCGCETITQDDKAYLHICEWHEGFDEGVYLMKEQA